jgi:hypothetical protein
VATKYYSSLGITYDLNNWIPGRAWRVNYILIEIGVKDVSELRLEAMIVIEWGLAGLMTLMSIYIMYVSDL